MHELESIWSIQKSNEVVLKRLLELLDIHLSRINERMTDLELLKNEISDYSKRIKKKLKK